MIIIVKHNSYVIYLRSSDLRLNYSLGVLSTCFNDSVVITEIWNSDFTCRFAGDLLAAFHPSSSNSNACNSNCDGGDEGIS